MKLFIADAFADELFCGNPAGVVILPIGEDFPQEELMMKTAAELRYSETAFVRTVGKGEFELRYFTPAAQVDLCGHATVAAFSALLFSGSIDDHCICTAHTRSGSLSVKIEDGQVFMDMAKPEQLAQITDDAALDELYAVMGLDMIDQRSRGLLLRPAIISTGLPDIIMPVADHASLQAIEPDYRALSRLSEKYGVIGVHAFSLEESGDVICRARNFAPLYGIDEEAATGTASGALTYYGYLNGFIGAGEQNRFLQGEKMGRPSMILSRIDAQPDTVSCRIRVGGRSRILVEGEILL